MDHGQGQRATGRDLCRLRADGDRRRDRQRGRCGGGAAAGRQAARDPGCAAGAGHAIRPRRRVQRRTGGQGRPLTGLARRLDPHGEGQLHEPGTERFGHLAPDQRHARRQGRVPPAPHRVGPLRGGGQRRSGQPGEGGRPGDHDLGDARADGAVGAPGDDRPAGPARHHESRRARAHELRGRRRARPRAGAGGGRPDDRLLRPAVRSVPVHHRGPDGGRRARRPRRRRAGPPARVHGGHGRARQCPSARCPRHGARPPVVRCCGHPGALAGRLVARGLHDLRALAVDGGGRSPAGRRRGRQRARPHERHAGRVRDPGRSVSRQPVQPCGGRRRRGRPPRAA